MPPSLLLSPPAIAPSCPCPTAHVRIRKEGTGRYFARGCFSLPGIHIDTAVSPARSCWTDSADSAVQQVLTPDISVSQHESRLMGKEPLPLSLYYQKRKGRAPPSSPNSPSTHDVQPISPAGPCSIAATILRHPCKPHLQYSRPHVRFGTGIGSRTPPSPPP